ncbi:MAG: penicillin acylase family protein [Deltaproteobacteria bacterium]|nr:penicillin acylase family protein [Deltaproteobacteria bacterium]MCL5277984.1 penicillin acylase family protein [Deltaproteobacteria bacterium]
MLSKKHSLLSLTALTVLTVSALRLAGCSAGHGQGGVSIGPNDPFTGLSVNQTIRVPGASLQSPVEIIRDTYGIPHIYGRTMTDVAFAQGYAEASDRLFEMDMFRHIADGTLTEYFGPGPGNSVLDEDIHSRIMGFSAIAQIVYDQTSPELKSVLQSFCNGINFYLNQLELEVQANPAANVLPAEYSSAIMGITITDIKPFTPQEIIAFGKFQSYSLTMEDEGLKIHATHYFDAAATKFTSASMDPGLAHFSGLSYDFARSEPAAKAPAVPLPNPFSYATSTTFSRLSYTAFNPLSLPGTQGNAVLRPMRTDQKAVQGAEAFYDSLRNGPFGFLYRNREAGQIGSNNWTIMAKLTKDGYPILENDTHLPLYNPPIWYEVHVNTKDIGSGDIDVIGVVFPMAPGVIIGHNDYIAWGDTVFPSDVIDVYQDTVVPGSPDSVVYNGQDIPIQTVPMTFQYGGALGRGLPVTTVTVDTYYVTIPGHGTMPVYPGSYTPGSSTALEAFTWTGMIPSNEFQAFYGIDQAQDLAQFITAQSYFRVGAQNFIYADIYGHIYLTDQSAIPIRGAYTLSHTTNTLPSGLTFSDFTYPPYLMLPGADPNFYWTGSMVPTSALPFTEDPEQGYIATANQDPVGVTYNNEPLDNPYYLGGFFDPGFRAQQIDRDIEAGEPNIDLAYVQNVIQSDHTDTYALRILPFLQKAYDDMANTITVTSDPQIATAMNYLDQWTTSTRPYDTPTGLSSSASALDISNSIATSIFEGFVQRLFYNIFYDKIQAIGQNRAISDNIIINTLLTVLEHPEQTATYSASEGHSTLLDALVPTASGYTFSERTLDQVMIQSLAQGISDLSAPTNPNVAVTTSFGTSDMSQWEWGKLHTLTFFDLLNLAAGNIFPQFNLPNSGTGYPRPGSMFSVDPGTFGFEMGNDSTNFYTNFTYGDGPAIRFSVEMRPGDIVGYNVLPGGESGMGPDPNNPPRHYGDQAALWVNNQVHEQWFYPKDIISHAESRTVFQPQ